MAKKRIAVLFGGASKDHVASLASAYDVIDALYSEHYDVIPIGITKAGRWLYYPGQIDKLKDSSWESDSDCCSAVLSPDPHHRGILKVVDSGEISILRVDVLFNLLHGKFGECGQIQGLCKLSGVAYVGCDEEAAAICNNKALTYLMLKKAGIKTPDFALINRFEKEDLLDTAKRISSDLPYPLFIKASSCSSSIGASIATNHDEFITGAKLAFSHHHQAVVEQGIFGRDLSCMVTGNGFHASCSVIGEIKKCDEPSENSLKFIDQTASVIIPAELDDTIIKQVQKTAVDAYKAVGCRGYARVDLKLYEDNIYCIKISALPGLARTSICAGLAQHNGNSYVDMLNEIINYAMDTRS